MLHFKNVFVQYSPFWVVCLPFLHVRLLSNSYIPPPINSCASHCVNACDAYELSVLLNKTTK